MRKIVFPLVIAACLVPAAFAQWIINGNPNQNVTPPSSLGATATRYTQTLYGFGDSFMAGYGSTNYSGTSFFALAARATPAPSVDYGVGGQTTSQIVYGLLGSFQPSATASSTVLLNGGANDINADTCGKTAGTSCTKSYGNMIQAEEAFVAIPSTYRQMASTATASGTWAADTTIPIYVNPLIAAVGTPVHAATSGNTLTFNIPTSAATKIGYTWEVQNSQTGTFTVSMDGSLKTDPCSGTTTFSSGPCGAVALVNSPYAIYRQEYAVTGGTTHAVVVTMTNSANVDAGWVDWTPPTGTAAENGLVYVATSPTYDSAGVYNAVAQTQAATLSGDGLPVVYVPLTGYVAASAENTTATAGCPASTVYQHPNDCGHSIIAADITTATATAYPFMASSAYSPITSENDVASSASPAFLTGFPVQTLLLTSNAYSTIASGLPGQCTTLQVIQNGTGGYTFALPGNWYGGTGVPAGQSAYTRNSFSGCWNKTYSQWWQTSQTNSVAAVLTSGSGAPSGSCTTGALYTNTTGTTGSLFYGCIGSAWVDIK